VLWVAGLFAIVGSPPFGMFLSEFTILKAALDQERAIVATAYLALLAVIAIGMITIVLRMAQGESNAPAPPPREPLLTVLPPALLGAAALILGLHLPAPLAGLLHHAARTLGGS
jgi:hydrogenase-4 component F